MYTHIYTHTEIDRYVYTYIYLFIFSPESYIQMYINIRASANVVLQNFKNLDLKTKNDYIFSFCYR